MNVKNIGVSKYHFSFYYSFSFHLLFAQENLSFFSSTSNVVTFLFFFRLQYTLSTRPLVFFFLTPHLIHQSQCQILTPQLLSEDLYLIHTSLSISYKLIFVSYVVNLIRILPLVTLYFLKFPYSMFQVFRSKSFLCVIIIQRV